MDDTCRRTDAAVDSWERAESPDPEELSRAATHIRQCVRCRQLYGPLVALILRDAGRPVRRDRADVIPGARFTAQVMETIHAGRARTRSPAGRLVKAALPVAAAVLLAAGLGIGLLTRLLRPQEAEIPVHFSIQAPGASRVSLAGDFNGWQPGTLNLKPGPESGTWEITIPLRRGSVYTYDFLIDGEHWVPDPNSAARVDDGFGGMSSVLRL